MTHAEAVEELLKVAKKWARAFTYQESGCMSVGLNAEREFKKKAGDILDNMDEERL